MTAEPLSRNTNSENFEPHRSTEHLSKVRDRLQQGRFRKAQQGGYAGYGSPAFGQKSINGELVKDEQEQAIIELIRRHHKSGKSLQQIANWLNENGHRTKRGHDWKRISVKRVLDRLYDRSGKAPGSSRRL
ncbi:MAG: recombinase family protein [Cyanobacteria bacterium P01_F01_bin.150]